MLATAGVAVGTAQADSLLAPLVIHDTTGGNAGTETYFAFKMRGVGEPDSFNVNYTFSPIHYTYIQKTTGMGNGADTGVDSIQDLHTYASTGGCHVQNNTGFGSSYDLIFQTATATDRTAWETGYETSGPLQLQANAFTADNSNPNGWNPAAGDFYGMMVIDDAANLPDVNPDPLAPISGRRAEEGELSGFAYIVNPAQGILFDYKLINNHLSKASGDFSPGYIAKQSVDWMWLPATNTRTPNPVANFTERTSWYSAVVGKGMSGAAENTPGGRWDEVVTFTQNDPNLGLHNNVIKASITKKNSIAASGAYDNDEDVVSGDKDLVIKCLGLYDRSDFLTSLQVPATVNGGWKPVYIDAGASESADPANVYGNGALTYRFDDLNGLINGTGPNGVPPHQGPDGLDIGITMQVETAGNRNAGGAFGQHPNRAY